MIIFAVAALTLLIIETVFAFLNLSLSGDAVWGSAYILGFGIPGLASVLIAAVLGAIGLYQ